MQSPFLALPQDWYWAVALAAGFGGLSGCLNGLRTAKKDDTKGRHVLNFFLGSVAGVVSIGLIRPGDALGILTTAGLAGWLKDAFMVDRASQFMKEKVDTADEMLRDIADQTEGVSSEGDGVPGGQPLGNNQSGEPRAISETAAASMDSDAVPAQDEEEVDGELAFARLLMALPSHQREEALRLMQLVLVDPEKEGEDEQNPAEGGKGGG